MLEQQKISLYKCIIFNMQTIVIITNASKLKPLFFYTLIQVTHTKCYVVLPQYDVDRQNHCQKTWWERVPFSCVNGSFPFRYIGPQFISRSRRSQRTITLGRVYISWLGFRSDFWIFFVVPTCNSLCPYIPFPLMSTLLYMKHKSFSFLINPSITLLSWMQFSVLWPIDLWKRKYLDCSMSGNDLMGLARWANSCFSELNIQNFYQYLEP